MFQRFISAPWKAVGCPLKLRRPFFFFLNEALWIPKVMLIFIKLTKRLDEFIGNNWAISSEYFCVLLTILHTEKVELKHMDCVKSENKASLSNSSVLGLMKTFKITLHPSKKTMFETPTFYVTKFKKKTLIFFKCKFSEVDQFHPQLVHSWRLHSNGAHRKGYLAICTARNKHNDTLICSPQSHFDSFDSASLGLSSPLFRPRGSAQG